MPLAWQRERAASIQCKAATTSDDGAAELIADGAMDHRSALQPFF
jgi:hypothetical protein